MSKICYVDKRFNGSSLEIIQEANVIIAEYAAQDYSLTLRQLYYQFVSRDLLPNTMQSYKRLGSIVNDARLAGLIDWEAIEDRTRNLERLSTWNGPGDIIATAAENFMNNLWDNQEYYVEVWVEKEALAAVVERAANQRRAPFFCCRGYTSQSEMWAASQRLFKQIIHLGKSVRIIHLGDHDPSGIDMTRDIKDRLRTFANRHLPRQAVREMRLNTDESPLKVIRIALNMDQVEQYGPPPNPTKITDSRAGSYIEEYGHESWELDALDPATLNALITAAVDQFVDDNQWEEDLEQEGQSKELLGEASSRWSEIEEMLSEDGQE